MNRKLLILTCIIFLFSNRSQGAVSFILKNHQTSAGSYITVPIKVKDFRNIVSFQGTLQFDHTMLSFISVQDYGLTSMNSSVFGITQTGSGKLSFSWIDGNLSDVSLNDSSTIFSVKFNVIGINGQIAALSFVNFPTVMEVIDSSFSLLPCNLVNGSVQIQTSVPVNSVTIRLDSVTGLQGSQVSISLRTNGLNNIISAQGTIQFDPTKVSYAGIGFFGLPGMNTNNFGINQISIGKLTFSWYDATLNGQNITGNSPLFSILFNLIGNAGDQTILSIVNTPTPVEIIDSLNQQLNVTTANGSIKIAGIPNQPILRLKIDSVAGPSPSQVIVPVRAWNFKKMISIQGTISFNTAIATFVSAEQFGLPGLDAGSFGTSLTGSGKLMFAWSDMLLNGQSVADSAILFALRFNITGSNGNFTTLNFVNAPTLLEFIDTSFSNINVLLQSGKIRINGTNTITTLNPSQLSYCVGDAISVSYNTAGSFFIGNKFILQLSDQNGSFASPINIDTVLATASGIIDSYLPKYLPTGSLYRVRVIATDPAITGSTNSSDVNISSIPFVFLGSDTIVCANQSLVLNAGNTGSTYLWSPGGQVSQSITIDSTGLGIGMHNISVQVTQNTCEANDTINITFSPCSGIEEVSKDLYFSLAPNPSEGLFSISFENIYGKVAVRIYNLYGQIIHTEQVEVLGMNSFYCNLRGITKGLYFVRCNFNDKHFTNILLIE